MNKRWKLQEKQQNLNPVLQMSYIRRKTQENNSYFLSDSFERQKSLEQCSLSTKYHDYAYAALLYLAKLLSTVERRTLHVMNSVKKEACPPK